MNRILSGPHPAPARPPSARGRRCVGWLGSVGWPRRGTGLRAAGWRRVGLLASLALLAGCHGTETDNPVAEVGDFVTPDRSRPSPSPPPGCDPFGGPGDGKPVALARVARVAGLEASVDRVRGLVLRGAPSDPGPAGGEGSTPAEPRSVGAVRGSIHQVLAGVGSSLLVASLEPPEVDSSERPEPAALDDHERVILLDLSNPGAPRRAAAIDLPGDFWSMQRAGDRLWVASARRVAEQRGCDAQRNACGFVYYEALVVSGYELDAGGLALRERRELPMSARALLSEAGAIGVDESGVYAARFQPDGSLEEPQRVLVPQEPYRIWPVGVDAGQLSLVRVEDEGGARLLRYDLDAEPPAVATDFALPALPGGAGPTSLLYGGYLFLDSLGAGAAQVWDLAGEPLRVAFEESVRRVLPIAGAATADGQLAIAERWAPNAARPQLELVALRAGAASVLEPVEGGELGGPGVEIPLPPSLGGVGERLALPGAGQPLERRLARPPSPSASSTRALVAVGSAAEPIEVALVASFVDAGVQPNPELVVERGGAASRLALGPGAEVLLPLEGGALAVAFEPRPQCEQSGRDCSRYAPGVAVVDLRAEPALRARLPFPELNLPRLEPPSRLEVRWAQEPPGLRLADGRYAFVAEVDVTCQTGAHCRAFDIPFVPIDQAGVNQAQPEACPPDADPCVVPEPPPPATVYGMARRQYFYVLDAAASEPSPSWSFAGFSELDSASPRPELGSRFAAPQVGGQVLFATRLERLDSAGQPLPRGVSRVFVDRFSVRGRRGVALEPVNVPGRPVALVGERADGEVWLCVEPLAGDGGRNRLNVALVTEAGASVLSSTELDPSLGAAGAAFVGRPDLDLRAVATAPDTQRVALVLTPENACGESRLQVFAARTDGTLELRGQLELPADGWQLEALQADRALLRRGRVFALVALDAAGSPRLVGLRSTPLFVERPVLVGDRVLAPAFRAGPMRLDF